MSEESNSSAARRAETGSDAMRAAVERMQAAIGEDHDTLERLRAGLADLALAVARAKAQAIEPEAAAPGKLDVAGLLNELEARVAGLIALLGLPAQDQRAPAEVPTVSHVVSQLGRGDETVESPATDAPTVSALGAMVEKLAASMFPEPPRSEPGAVASPPAGESEPPRAAVLPELDLMSNFARLEAIPHLPPEIGTAVIFEKPAEPVAEPKPPERDTAEAVQPEAAAPDPIAEPVAASAPTLEAVVPLAAETPLEPTVAEAPAEPTVGEAQVEPIDLDPADILAPPPPAAAAAAEADDDPAGFLLEPLPDTPAPVTGGDLVAPQLQRKIPHDPLAPLKALSDVEKIALFS